MMFKYLPQMSRVEVNNLARNRFLEDQAQCWIAKNGHLSARYYLAENPNLCKEATTILLNGRSTIVKGMLVSFGHVVEPRAIREIYKLVNKSNLSQTDWRISNFFIQNRWGHKAGYAPPTPSDVVEEIFEKAYKQFKLSHRYGNTYYLSHCLGHPNTTTKCAIIASQSTDARLQRAGFDALTKIKKNN